MDNSWIMKPQTSAAYEQGIVEFINFAFKDEVENGKVICPCRVCRFKKPQSRSVMFDHLKWSPFPKGYTVLLHHGESLGETSSVSTSTIPNIGQDTVVVEDSIQNMINDAFGVDRDQTNKEPIASNVEIDRDEDVIPSSDKSLTMILELLKDAFEFASIPSSFYEAKKTITKLGMNYVKIPACPNDCMLYWGEDEERETCKICNTSKWKSGEKDCVVNNRKKVPTKVLRYFPLKPRLKRLFFSSKTAEDMRWHAVDNNNDGMMRHPRDSEAWKQFDLKHTWFASDPRNLRLALASDGFNPFGVMSSNYSIWPAVLIPYNTPPCLCMKDTSFIMSMIIPGKYSPGNDIDVYLQPLVKELKELWTTGVDTYDSFKKEVFTLHGTLMWTISDFPGLGMLSGWNTYTGFACPSCNTDTEPCRLQNSSKWCFMGHSRYLDRRHKFRLNKVHFDGEQEMRSPPVTLSGHQVLQQVENIKVIFGKKPKKAGLGKRKGKKQPTQGDPPNQKKRTGKRQSTKDDPPI
ncbi:uncharacterized protein [Medicago truncatula]|uniref:uncharacterized protein n=1 Tax=Medicago truncatula TaxID=3880 RepID=UPI000D2F425D|nr:uncharacterized protein LOC112422785 [Medicago truncatula]